MSSNKGNKIAPLDLEVEDVDVEIVDVEPIPNQGNSVLSDEASQAERVTNSE